MEPLGAEVVQALPDHPQGIVHIMPVPPAPLAAPRVPCQPIGSGRQQPDQRLAVQRGHRLHLVQQPSLLRPVCLQVTPVHAPQIRSPLVNRHPVVVWHRSLSVTFSVEGTVLPSVTF